MKVAVTYDKGQVFQHFGHTKLFKVYEIKDGAIVSEVVLPTMGSGHGALANFLVTFGVDTLICGGIGGGARAALAEAGIALYPGATGDADEQVKALMEGRLAYDPDTVCDHHHGEGEHNCGDHDCGSHEGHDCGHHCK